VTDLILLLSLILIIRNLFLSDLISPLFLFSLLSLFLYYTPYFIMDTFLKQNYIDLSYMESFYTFIFLSLLGFTLGYELIYRNSPPKEVIRADDSILERIDTAKLINYIVFFGVLGTLFYSYFIIRSGLSYFSGHLHGDYSVGGYIYELRYFIFSSILVLFNLKLLNKITGRINLLIIAFTIFLILDAYIQQQRGSWIRLMIIFGFSYVLFTYDSRQYKSLKLGHLLRKYYYLILLLPLPALILTFNVWVRKYTELPLREQLTMFYDEISENPVIILFGSGTNEGNEFVVAYNAFHGRESSGVIDYGLKWAYPFMNFIPRALWADKPQWNTFSISVFDIIDNYSFITSAPGSAESGIIETSYRFAWLTPLFFIFLGSISSKLYLKSINGNLHQRSFYICYLIGLFYFITQNMMPFIIFTLYMYIPIYISFRLAKK
jgi:hypothetical protein